MITYYSHNIYAPVTLQGKYIIFCSVIYYILMVYIIHIHRSNIETDLTIEKQWRTSLQVCVYKKLRI